MLALSACGDLATGQAGAAPSRCDTALLRALPGETARLVASFENTAAELAAWDESGGPSGGSRAGPGMSPARALPPTAPIFTCYFDGPVTLTIAHPPQGGSPPTAARVLLVLDESGTILEVRGGTKESLPLVSLAAPSPAVQTAPAAPAPRTVLATWRTTPIASSEIAALLTRAGLPSRIPPPAPARALLYGSTDLDLLAIDDPAIKGATIYRYPSVAAANAAFLLEPIQNPAGGTVMYMWKPHFIGIGDTIVAIATDDDAVAARVIAALARP
jgi:hypothetical protein